MLWTWRRCPLWLCEPLFCLWWYSCTLAPFRRLYGLFTVFCEVCRLYICRCGLLCGSVAAFYGVGVVLKGTGLKSLYGANTGVLRGAAFPGCAVPVVFCAAVGGSVALCGYFAAVGVVLYPVPPCVALWGLCGVL